VPGLAEVWFVMPRRSTAFQKAVYYIERNLAGPTYAVIESKMLRDRISGQEREVDIVIEGNFDRRNNVIFSIECREQKKRASITWVEEMWAKHHTLSTDRLILVSVSGFTPRAREKAASLGIELLSPNALAEDGAADIVRSVRRVWFGPIEIDYDTSTLVLASTQYAPRREVEVDERWAICSAEGEQLQSAAELISECRERLLQQLKAEWFESEQFRLRVELGPPGPLYVQETIPETHLALIEKVVLVCTVRARVSAIQLEQGQLSETAYSYGFAKSARERTTAVITQDSSGEATLSIEFDPSQAVKRRGRRPAS
jgi:hypothetical protein